MSRLYWRIFIAFWLVIVITVAIAVTASTVSLLAELDTARVETLRTSLDALAEQAERELISRGKEGLTEWLSTQVQARPDPPLLVVGPDDHELLNRPLMPGPPMRVVQRLRETPAAARTPPERLRFPARVLTAANGDRYVLLVPLRGPPSGGWFFRPEFRLLLLGVALLVSGVVCYFLARQLTRPIQAFRDAGLRIADSDLATRIGGAITRRRDEFGALARDFNRMAERIEVLVNARQRLLRDVSHELRSPLARLQVAVGLARQRSGTDAMQDLDRIEREADRLNELIGQILSFTRLDSMDGIDRHRVDMSDLLAGVVDDARYEGRATGLEVNLENAAGAVISADESLLRSAIENVLRNALQHAKQRVNVTMIRGADGWLHISIADDGPGVAPGDLPRLFEPFYTSQQGATRYKGSGLGLAIARRAIELHGGSINVRNGAGTGLTVEIEVPGGQVEGNG